LKPTAECARSSAGSAESAPSPGRCLVLGLGNTLISDDGFGPAVVEACCRLRAERVRENGERGDGGKQPAVEFLDAAAAGLRLLDLLAGSERALILDVVQSGLYPPGTLLEWPAAAASNGRSLGGSHQCDLLTALALGRALGVPLPGEVTLLVAEAEDLETIAERLTREVERAVPRAAALVEEWIERRGRFLPEEAIDHVQARKLS
jgi:hydrogenase maturation protease